MVGCFTGWSESILVCNMSNFHSGGGAGLTDTELRATPVTVDATSLDIRSLSSATDNVTIVPSGTQTISGTVEITNDVGNPVPVSGTITINQPTHDNLNLNANLQMGNVDVGESNPVYIDTIGPIDANLVGEQATVSNGGPLSGAELTKIVSGYDGTNARTLKTDTAGELQVDVLTIPTNQPTTPTVTTVGDTTTSTQLIASNTSRKEVEFYNGSTAILYLLKGTGTASATNYTVQLNQGDYYNSDVTSAFQGVWSADSGGSALITSSE